MANVTRDRLSASLFIGDVKGIVDASDIAATPANVLGRPCIKFPDGSDESAAVTHVLPVPSNYAGGNIIARIAYCGDSAPGANNGVNFEGAFEAISESDAHDLGPFAPASRNQNRAKRQQARRHQPTPFATGSHGITPVLEKRTIDSAQGDVFNDHRYRGA